MVNSLFLARTGPKKNEAPSVPNTTVHSTDMDIRSTTLISSPTQINSLLFLLVLHARQCKRHRQTKNWDSRSLVPKAPLNNEERSADWIDPCLENASLEFKKCAGL